uniref:unconventional myosin-X-like n=1 Tax=Myxine glutinosa TaxID=7769 RepID=UPI00358F5575
MIQADHMLQQRNLSTLSQASCPSRFPVPACLQRVTIPYHHADPYCRISCMCTQRNLIHLPHKLNCPELSLGKRHLLSLYAFSGVAVTNKLQYTITPKDSAKDQQVPQNEDARKQRAATIIQACILAFLARRKFCRQKASVIRLQTWFRGIVKRRSYVALRAAAITVQRHFRAQRAKKCARTGDWNVNTHMSSWKRMSLREESCPKQILNKFFKSLKNKDLQLENINQIPESAKLQGRPPQPTRKSLQRCNDMWESLCKQNLSSRASATPADRIPRNGLWHHQINPITSDEEDEGFVGSEEQTMESPLKLKTNDNTNTVDSVEDMDLKNGSFEWVRERFRQSAPNFPSLSSFGASAALSATPPSEGPLSLYGTPQGLDYDLETEGSLTSTDTSLELPLRYAANRSQSTCRDFRYSVGTYRNSFWSTCSSDGQQHETAGDVEQSFDHSLDEDEELAAQRNTIYSTTGPSNFESFLYMKTGVLGTWKLRWCMLRDDTFMWFRARQEAVRSGWLLKLANRSSSLSRVLWRRRWFVLHAGELLCYENDREDKLHYTIDVQSIRHIQDQTEQENGIDMVMPDKTFRFIASSPEDASAWFNSLMLVHKASDFELKHLPCEDANPQNAMGTLDIGLIDSVNLSKQQNKSHCFSIEASGRRLNFAANAAEDKQRWLSLLQRSKGDAYVQGQEFIVRGWLYKALNKKHKEQSPCLKKRWVVLTQDSLDVYRSSVRGTKKLGSLVLSSLCCVEQLGEKQHNDTGFWGIIVHGRTCTFHLFSRLVTEASRWASAVQTVIESKMPIATATQRLLTELRHYVADPHAIEQFYTRNPILRYSSHPLQSPLTPIPFGKPGANKCSAWAQRSYGPLQEEALHIYNTLLMLHSMHDPFREFRDVLQTCLDLPYLRDELYCQLVKQTVNVPNNRLPAAMLCWQLLACACVTFPPNRTLLRYVRFHLKRIEQRHTQTIIGWYARFGLTGLHRTCMRSLAPSRTEMQAIARRQDLAVIVQCHVGGTCRVPITNLSTAGELVDQLLCGLAMEDCHNVFALFEQRGDTSTAIENHVLVVDVLAKFERSYEGVEESQFGDQNGWHLGFKLYCYLDTMQIPLDSVEFVYMFEQAHESVLRGHFPASSETLQHLAALRLQYEMHNFSGQADLPGSAGLRAYYPLCQLRAWPGCRSTPPSPSNPSSMGGKQGPNKPPTPASPSLSTSRQFSRFLGGTLRCTIRRRTASQPTEAEQERRRKSCDNHVQEQHAVMEEAPSPNNEFRSPEAAAVTADVLRRWAQLRGLSKEEAMMKYMATIREWSGYGATLFDVQCEDGSLPQDLWLAVSVHTVAVYVQGQHRPLEAFPYGQIVTMGSPGTDLYRISLRGRDLLFRSSQVVEIAKLMKVYIGRVVLHHSHRRTVNARASWSGSCY